MALGTAFVGTLALGQLVGAETHWELLILVALAAAAALVFERLTLQSVPDRTPPRDAAPRR